MPISVSCPGCPAKFNVKDEYAGKRAKCPKCGGPITVPTPAADFEFVDDEPAPAPVAARPVTAKPVAAKPVAAAKPRVVEDDEDEPVSPKRKRGASSDEDDTPKAKSKRRQDADDADDAPKGKKRRAAADEDEDDRPKNKRRRDEDDDEPKKKSALPLILAGIAGVVLIGGGIAVAVVLMSGGWSAKATGTQPPTALGQNPPVGQPPTVTTDELADNVSKYLGQTVVVRGSAELVGGDGKKGSIILRGGAMQTQIVCNFENTGNTAKPTVGDVVEVRGLVEPVSNVAQVRLKDCQLLNGKPVDPTPPETPPETPTPPVTPPTTPPADDADSIQPVVTLTSAELTGDIKRYDGKWVVVAVGVAGDVAEGTDLQAVPFDVLGVEFRVSYANGGKLPAAVKRGQRMEIWGLLAAGPGNAVRLTDSVLLNPVAEVKLGEVYDDFMKDAKAATAKYQSQTCKFTATVKAVESGEAVVEAKPGNPSPVRLSFPPGELKRIKKGEVITLVGTPAGVSKAGNALEVNNCLLVPKQLPPGPK